MPATNNTRASYIKQYTEEQQRLQESLGKMTEDTIINLLGEAASNKVRQILSEGEDTFEVEEVGTDDAEGETEDKKPGKDGEETEITDVTVEEPAEKSSKEDDKESATDSDDIDWAEIDKLADESGEIDLTGCAPETCAKVLKAYNPDSDQVRVIDNGNGTLELKDNEAGTHYVIDLEGTLTTDECGEGGCGGEEPVYSIELEDEEPVYSIDVDVDESVCNEDTNLGYTDNYQGRTAMTTSPNDEVANPKSTYSMDAGVPKGTSKPYAGPTSPAKVGQPFEDEVQVNETMTTQEDGPYNRGDGMLHGNTNSKAAVGRNARIGGRQVHGTGDNSYSQAQMESIKRKANEVFRENRQLAALLPKMKKQLEEAIVVNQSLSNIVRLVESNSTTREEKADMIRRFNEVKTREESNKLYTQINEELKRKSANAVGTPTIPGDMLAESKNATVAKPLYESEDVSEVLSFWNRLKAVK
ncbi:MAG: hypothetical protein LUD72_10065 [Bacteroidales bacterium]|nr:hypothetical protein [Bacteroidales bacterium]